MAIKPHCYFCKKELTQFGAILLGPPRRGGVVDKFHLCRVCFGNIVLLRKFSVDEIEDIVSLGPTWLNYTRKQKRKRNG